MLNDAPSCGNCFLYTKKKTCPIDGRHRLKVNDCYMNYQPKDKDGKKIS